MAPNPARLPIAPGSGAANTTDYWLHYNPAETERDLTYADRLKVNQLRVFVNCASWQNKPAAFRRNLVDMARACNRHQIGLMITIIGIPFGLQHLKLALIAFAPIGQDVIEG